MTYSIQLACLLALFGCTDVHRVSLGGPAPTTGLAGREAAAGRAEADHEEAGHDAEHADDEHIDKNDDDGAQH